MFKFELNEEQYATIAVALAYMEAKFMNTKTGDKYASTLNYLQSAVKIDKA